MQQRGEALPSGASATGFWQMPSVAGELGNICHPSRDRRARSYARLLATVNMTVALYLDRRRYLPWPDAATLIPTKYSIRTTWRNNWKKRGTTAFSVMVNPCGFNFTFAMEHQPQPSDTDAARQGGSTNRGRGRPQVRADRCPATTPTRVSSRQDAAALERVQQAYTDYDAADAAAYKQTRIASSAATSHATPARCPGRGSGAPAGAYPYAAAAEGTACTSNGAPGHLRQVNGKLECVPDRRQDAATVDAKRLRTHEYDREMATAYLRGK